MNQLHAILAVVAFVAFNGVVLLAIQQYYRSRCGANVRDASDPFPTEPCILPRGHAGEHKDRNGLCWQSPEVSSHE